MPDFIGLSVEWMAGLLFLIPIGSMMGIVAFAIACGGRRAGMVFGVLASASGLCGLWALLLWTPHLWWIAMVPIGIGAAALRAWVHHAGPGVARRPRFDLRGLFALILLIGVICAGISSQHPQTQLEEQAAARLEALPGGKSNQISWQMGRVTEVLFSCPSTRATSNRPPTPWRDSRNCTICKSTTHSPAAARRGSDG
jgi:hypothetical protein